MSKGRRVISSETAHAVLEMMESVVSQDGTAQQAAVAGYRMAGKTGTVKRVFRAGNLKIRTVVIRGVAPVSDPRLVMVVMIDDPRGEIITVDWLQPGVRESDVRCVAAAHIAPDDMKGDWSVSLLRGIRMTEAERSAVAAWLCCLKAWRMSFPKTTKGDLVLRSTAARLQGRTVSGVCDAGQSPAILAFFPQRCKRCCGCGVGA